MDNKICIVGGGAIGSVLAYFLYRSGIRHIPVYYASEESYRVIRDQGGVYVYDKRLGEEHLVPIEPRLSECALDECMFVLNAVKAYDVPESLKIVQRIAFPGSVVIMLQNGFGSLEYAEENLHEVKVSGGVVYCGAERVNRGKVLYHGGNTVIAGCRKVPCIELEDLARIFRLGGLDFRMTDNIDYYRWLKLALNAVINPITATLMTRNKIILEKESLELAKLILREVCEVARLHGYRFDEKRLLMYIKKNVEIVSDNISSMAQDIIHGRKTEIDYINGYIAKQLGRENSVNYVLTLLVKLAEKRHGCLS